MDTTRALTENLAALLRREHHAFAEFLVALADFDRQRCWVELGHTSLFYFLHRELRLSKGAAQYRKVAAELIQRIPGAVEPLRQGRLCLTSIIEAAKVVTADNWETVLPRFYGLSKREAMEVVAALEPHPAPPAKTIVTPVRPAPFAHDLAPAPTAIGPARALARPVLELEQAPRPVTMEPAPVAGWPDEPAHSPIPPAATTQPLEVVPLTAQQSRLHATVTSRFLRKLEAARDALSHARPGATPGEILEAGLDLILAQAAKRRGQVLKPRNEPRPARTDRVPAQVKRVVWARDGGRCQWPLASGGVCGSTRRLELDHVQPLSLGGNSTTDNLRVLCRAHNDLAARLALGDQTMDRYTLGLLRAPGRARPDRVSSASAP